MDVENENVEDNARTLKSHANASRRMKLKAALCSLNWFKATGSSGINGAMVNATGNSGVSMLTAVANELLPSGDLPSDFKRSSLVPLFKGKGDPLSLNYYPGNKFLEHLFNIIEKVLEVPLQGLIEINDTEFGFMPGRGTTDAVYVARQLCKKSMAKKKRLNSIFVDLEKAFEKVPRKVMSLRFSGVPEPLESNHGNVRGLQNVGQCGRKPV